MPHRVIWNIRPFSNLDVEHYLHIELDPKQVKQGLLTPPHNLEIYFPKGPTFTAFNTTWRNAPTSFPGLQEDWGHEINPTSGERWYRISYLDVVKDMPQWNGRSTIILEVSTCQLGAWSIGAKDRELALKGVKIHPPVDGEICVFVPKPKGRWARLCERLLFHLNLGVIHKINGVRIPLTEEADQPIIDESDGSVKFYFSSTRAVDLQTMRVMYSRGGLYEWLTSKKVSYVLLGLAVVIGTIVYWLVQLISFIISL